MARVLAGPECVPVKAIIRGLVQQVRSSSERPFHDALICAVRSIRAAYPDEISNRTKGQYGNVYSTYADILAREGISDIPARLDLDATPENQDEAELKALLSEAAEMGAPGPVLMNLPDGALDDVMLFDGVPALPDDVEIASSSKLIQYAQRELLPEYMARKARRPNVRCYVHEGQLYAIVLTESGIPANGGRISLNLTVEPYRSYQKAPPDVALQTGSGKTAHARVFDPDDPDHKWWAQFVVHKPGRKLRFFGSKEICKGEWADVPAATHYIVMTDSEPWLRAVTFEEFRRLPNVEG